MLPEPTEQQHSKINIWVRHPARVMAAGIDLTDVDRIDLALSRSGERLLARLCCPSERTALKAYPPDLRSCGVALCFGVKESVVKAAGGFPRGGRFTDIDASSLLERGLPPDGQQHQPVRLTGATAASLTDIELVAGARGLARQLLCWVLGHSTDDPTPSTAKNVT